MKIKFVMLGKTQRAEIRTLLADYLARLRHYAEIEVLELRNGSTGLRKLKFDRATTLILLDAGARQFTSVQFARWLAEQRDRGTRALVFLCGDAAGFPEGLGQRASVRLSLSTLTMPHEFSRVVLAEQIYRAFTILAGHPYAK